MALDFPSSPSATDVHNAANGLQYVFDGVKWISQGRYDTGAINAEKLDNISSNFNGVLTTFNLKVNNEIVKPASAESLHIVLAGHLQEPDTAYTINSVNGTITFASAPSNGTAFFGVVLSRLPITNTTGSGEGEGSITSVTGSSPIVSSGGNTPAISITAATSSAAGSMSASDKSKLDGIESNSTADQTPSEIKTAYESNSDTNAFTDAEETKLSGIETNADVTDASNVDAAGAIMNSDLDGKGEILVGDGSGDPTALSVGTDGYVLKANSSTATGLQWAAESGGGGSVNSVSATAPIVSSGGSTPSISITGATTSAAGSMSSSDKSKLDGIADNANNYSLPTASGSTLGGIKVGTNLSIDGNGVLSASASSSSVTASDINAAFPDNGNLILGDANSTSGDDALKLYYNGFTGIITSDGGVQIQFDGSTKLNTLTWGVRVQGDLKNLSDSHKIYLGADSDLEIFHDGTDSFITNATGNLVLRNTSGDAGVIGLQPKSGENAIICRDDNNVELFFDNSKKLETKSSGVEVTGNVIASGFLTGTSDALTPAFTAKGDGSSQDGYIQLNCSQNSHGVKIKSPPHSANASYTLTFPNDVQNGKFLKTDTNGNLSWATPTDTNTQLSNSQVRAAVEAASDSNVFTDADHTKLNSVETNADVTDATNVDAAGAVMNSDLATKGQILIGDGSGDPTALSVGTNNYVLTADSTQATGVKWAAASGGGGFSSDSSGNLVAGNSSTGEDLDDPSSTGYNNVILGSDSGKSLTSGYSNTILGPYCGGNLETGDNNVIIGQGCGTNYKGNESVLIGLDAGKHGSGNNDGDYNVCIGKFAGKDLNRTYGSVLIGNRAGQSFNHTGGSPLVATGSQAAYIATNGTQNAVYGHRAAYLMTTGSKNTCIGNKAGASNLTTGSNNICLGHEAYPSATTASNEITLGDSNIATLRCNVQTISSLSDGRDKTNVTDLPEGLDFINKLRPVKFEWKTRERSTKIGYEAGFIAQDLQLTQKETETEYLKLVMDSNPDRLEASYGKLVPILVKAIQELTIEVNKLKSNV